MIFLVAMALVTVAAPVTALAQPSRVALERDLRRDAARLGSRSSVVVVDAMSRRTVFARRAGTIRPLGSTTKLFTAAAVLGRLPAPATAVLVTAPVGADGTVNGDVVLRGGGDPTFGSAAFVADRFGGTGATAESLAAAVQAAGVRTVAGSVVGDESAFDGLRGPAGPPVLGELEPLSALSYNRSRASDTGPPQDDPARSAAQRFDDALEARGIVIRGVPRTGQTPAGAVPVASLTAPSVARLVELMLKPSDDFIAEMLTKGIGRPAGAGTTASGAAAIVRFASKAGVRVRLVDGSGLDPRDQASARELVALLAVARRRARLRPLLSALPRPGEGTLSGRRMSAAARARCRAKTGTLPARRTSALAGLCRTADGRTLLFVVLSEGRSVAAAQVVQDRIVRRLARARGTSL